MIDKLELTKLLRKARAATYAKDMEYVRECIDDAMVCLDEPEPKTIEDALRQFEQHQQETHNAQSRFLEQLKQIQKNIR